MFQKSALLWTKKFKLLCINFGGFTTILSSLFFIAFVFSTAKLLKHWATMTNVSFACLTIVSNKKNSSTADVKVRMDETKETKNVNKVELIRVDEIGAKCMRRSSIIIIMIMTIKILNNHLLCHQFFQSILNFFLQQVRNTQIISVGQDADCGLSRVE